MGFQDLQVFPKIQFKGHIWCSKCGCFLRQVPSATSSNMNAMLSYCRNAEESQMWVFCKNKDDVPTCCQYIFPGSSMSAILAIRWLRTLWRSLWNCGKGGVCLWYTIRLESGHRPAQSQLLEVSTTRSWTWLTRSNTMPWMEHKLWTLSS